MNKMISKISRRSVMAAMLPALLSVVGCIHRHPKKPATLPDIPSTIPTTGPTTLPVATGDLGTAPPLPGLAKKPKPFIAFPKLAKATTVVAKPSTLLLEHASPDSPVPLSEYGNQPVFNTADFHLRADLSAADVRRRLGPPAQLADNEDPWLVYRLHNDTELWLHFGGPDNTRLLAADIIHGVEDGYARDRVFEAP